MTVKDYEYTGEKPLNREPPLEELISSFITEKNGYDRNHGPIPIIDASAHRVSVDGAVRTPLSLSLADLRSLPQHTVVCALQCAGNRRHTMRTEMKEVSGLDWFDGAVMNCAWRGPRLRDVLLRAGVALSPPQQASAHVAFACHQTACEDDAWYGASIPLAVALRPSADVLLALEMNGRALAPNHGHPVRVVAPGIAGARAVKWLDRIVVQAAESQNFYQQRDYKILPPHVDSAAAAARAWHAAPSIQDMPVNSVVGAPASGATVARGADGRVEVRGYALPAGADGPVVRVEVSGDGGATWRDAELVVDGRGSKWAWCLWRARVEVEAGKGRRVLSRATDKGGNVQVERPQWNFRGCAYNGYGEAKGLEII